MKIIGLTGGIGSGKSTVARIFEAMGIPIYYADDRAKALYLEDQELQQQVIQHFGSNSYQNGKLNRTHLANEVFKDKRKLKLLNQLVHPKVAKDFMEWKKLQRAEYVIKEAAILFESGSYKNCNATITVAASKQERIQRVMKRDKTTEELVEKRIDNQMTDRERKTMANFEILNFSPHLLIEQVYSIHHSILST